eukprot:evm.model.scf_1223.1 EVM.evm.TU.scf_1223.1   scf_1223:16154-19336(+)
MDGLECRLVEVAGRTYRVQGGVLLMGHPASSPADAAPQAAAGGPNLDEGGDGDDPRIVREDASTVVTRISADSEVYGTVMGRGGKTKERLEKETGATIILPRKGANAKGEITIRGCTVKAVASARARVEIIINDVVTKRLDYNYFVSIPLTTEAIQQAHRAFREAVLSAENGGAAGIDKSIFTPGNHLHMTIVMLKLYSDEKRNLARKALEDASRDVKPLLPDAGLMIRLKGLGYMNDDPSAIDVMYLNVLEPEEQSIMRKVCTVFVDKLSQAGLLLAKDEGDVKMHVTLLNSRFRRQQGVDGRKYGRLGGEERVRARLPFDGRGILDAQGDLDLGETRVAEVHLSQRWKFDSPGYFHCAHRVVL